MPSPGLLSIRAVAARLAGEAVDHRQAEAGPLPTSLVVKKGSNTRSATSGGMPAPVSVMVSLIYSPRRAWHRGRAPRWRRMSGAAVHGVARVDRQVEDGGLELGRVDHDRHQRDVEVELHFSIPWPSTFLTWSHALDERRDMVERPPAAGPGRRPAAGRQPEPR